MDANALMARLFRRFIVSAGLFVRVFLSIFGVICWCECLCSCMRKKNPLRTYDLKICPTLMYVNKDWGRKRAHDYVN